MKRNWMMGNMLMAPEGESKPGSNAPSSELEAIKKIAEQVDEFKKLLGDRAKQEDFDKLKSDLEALKDGLSTLSAKQITDQIEAINKANESIHKQIVEMQEEAAKNAEKPGETSKVGGIQIDRKEIEALVKAVFPNGASKGKNHNSLAQINIKAPEIFGSARTYVAGSDPTAFTGRYVDPTLYQRRRKTNIILDYFNIQVIGVPTLVYLRKIEIGSGTAPDNEPGSADWILCGEEKPQRSFRVTTGTAQAKKVAIYGNIEDCLLKDVPSFERWIREDFMDEMREEINNGLLNNNPAVNAKAPLGLKIKAKQFSATPAFDQSITDPTYIDMIIALAARMEENRETPNIVFVAKDVWYRIHALKANDGRYMNNNLIYTDSLGRLFIAGVEVVRVDSEDVPSTAVLMLGAEVGFKIYRYGDITWEQGLNGTDFRHDRTSYRSWAQFLSFIPEERENSVMYDTWANIEAAIAVEEEEEVVGG